MKKGYYILFLLLGLIPATFLFFMILICGIFGFGLSGKVFYLIEMILATSGYLGFLSLFRGLKKQYFKLNLILLVLGLIGFNMFLFLDEEMESVRRRILSDNWSLAQLLLFILPNIISLTFVVVILIKMYNDKNEK